jgi:hypothetical protein
MEADFRLLARTFNRVRALYPFDLTAWVFLPDPSADGHSIAALPYPATILQVNKGVKQSSRTGMYQRRGTEGELWQPHVFDCVLRPVQPVARTAVLAKYQRR